MPTIDVRDELLGDLLGEIPAPEELERLLSTAKAEVEDYDAGHRRAPGGAQGHQPPRPVDHPRTGAPPALLPWRPAAGVPVRGPGAAPADTGERVVEVDSALETIRPCIAAFVASGPPVAEALLLELIQSQEKLSDSYGQRRRAIAMGLYRARAIDGRCATAPRRRTRASCRSASSTNCR